MIDNLHLFLRVADVLNSLLITELRRQDAIQKQLKFTNFIRDPRFSVLQLTVRTLTGPIQIVLVSQR